MKDRINTDPTKITKSNTWPQTDEQISGVITDSSQSQEGILSPRESLGTFILGNHKVSVSDNWESFECLHCDEEYEVPDLIAGGRPFHKVVYQLYLLGKFTDIACRKLQTDDGSSSIPDPRDTNIPGRPNPGDVYWVGDAPVIFHGHDDGKMYWQTENGVSTNDDLKQRYSKKELAGLAKHTGIPGLVTGKDVASGMQNTSNNRQMPSSSESMGASVDSSTDDSGQKSIKERFAEKWIDQKI